MKKHFLSTNLSLFLIIILLSSCSKEINQQNSNKPTVFQSKNSVNELNREFRKIYAQTRNEVYMRHSPAILTLGDSLILYRKGKRIAKRTTPEIYHNLKSLSHASLAIYVMLGFEEEPTLNESKITEVQKFLELLQKVKVDIPTYNLTKEQEKYNDNAIQMCIDYLKMVIEAQKVEYSKLKAFVSQVDKLFALNVKYSVKSQLDLVHQVMTNWYKDFSEEEKKNLKVIMSGPKVAREQALLTQYFAKFLGEKGESHKLIYAESVYSEKGLRKTLGTDIVDTQVGVAFFDDPERMHRDLLSDEAKAYIKTLNFK